MSEQFDPSEGIIGPLISLLLVTLLIGMAWYKVGLWLVSVLG